MTPSIVFWVLVKGLIFMFSLVLLTLAGCLFDDWRQRRRRKRRGMPS